MVLWESMTYLDGSIKCQVQCIHKGTVTHIRSTKHDFYKTNVVIPLSQDHWSNIFRYPDTSQKLGYKFVRPLGSFIRWHEPMHLLHSEAIWLQHPVYFLLGKSNKLCYCVCFLRGEANKDSRSWPADPSQKRYLTAWQEKCPKEYKWQLYSLKIIVQGWKPTHSKSPRCW